MATPVFCCGFECGVLNAAAHWNTVNGSPSFSTTTVRSGARSLRTNGTAASCRVVGNPYPSGTRKIGRFYVYFATLAGNTRVCGPDSASGTGPMVWVDGSNQIVAKVDTILGATGVPVTTGQWYRIDFDFNQNDGAGHCTADVQVDGVACAQASNTTTFAASTTLYFGNAFNVTHDFYFDDFLASVTPADYPLGAGYVNHFVPTSDGTHNIAGTADFQRGNTAVDILNATTTAYQLIDDVPLPSGAVNEADCIRGVAPANPTTDYVECVFGPAPGIATPTTGPRMVDAVMARHELATTVSQSRVALNDNGTLSDIWNTSQAGVVTYSYNRAGWADPPSAATAWGVTSGNGNFNNVRVRFFSPDANPDNALDAIMLEAEFAPAATTQAVTTTAITAGSALTAPTVTPDQAVTTQPRASTATLYAPVATQPPPAGPVGSVWAANSWGTTVWTENSWANAVVAAQSITTQPRPSTTVLNAATITTTTLVTTGTRVAAASVNAPVAAYSVVGVFRASLVALFAPLLAINISTGTVAQASVLTAPTVAAGPVAVTTGTRATTVALNGPTIAPGPVSVAGQVVGTTAILNVPTVAVGPITITGQTVNSTIALTVPTIAPGPVAVTTGTRTAASVLNVLTVAPGPASVTGAFRVSTTVLNAPTAIGILNGATIGSDSTLFAPSTAINIATGTRTTTVVANAPSVGYEITGAFRSSTTALSVPSIATGPVTVLGATIPIGSQTFLPIVSTGAIPVVTAFIAPTTVLTAPSTTINISGAFCSSTAVLFAPSTTITISTGLRASTLVVFAPSVATLTSVTGNTIAATSQLSAPSIAVDPASVTGATIASTTQTFTASVLVGGTPIVGNFIASTATLFAPSAVGVLNGSFISSGNTRFAPTVLADQAVTLGTVVTGNVRFAPAVSIGVIGATRVSGLVLNSPTIVAGPVAVIGATLAPGSLAFAPFVGAGTYQVGGVFRASTVVLFAPATTTVTAVVAAHCTSTLQLFAPVVVPGPVSQTGAYILSTVQIYPPTTAAHISLPFAITQVGPLFPPSLTPLVTVPFISPSTQLFPAMVGELGRRIYLVGSYVPSVETVGSWTTTIGMEGSITVAIDMIGSSTAAIESEGAYVPAIEVIGGVV